MLSRVPRLLLFLSLLAAAPLAAQAPAAPTLFRFTAFGGYHFGLVQRGAASVALDSLLVPASFAARSAGGALTGIRVEAPVERLFVVPQGGGINLVASLAFGRGAAGSADLVVDLNRRAGTDTGATRDTVLVVSRPQGRTRLVEASLGVGLRLPVLVPMELILAPMLVRVEPRDPPRDALDPAGAVTYPGVQVGTTLTLPTRVPGLAVEFAGMDALTFANVDLADRFERYLRVAAGATAPSVDLPRRPSHRLLLSVGVTVQR